jgi:hypothetical protein
VCVCECAFVYQCAVTNVERIQIRLSAHMYAPCTLARTCLNH